MFSPHNFSRLFRRNIFYIVSFTLFALATTKAQTDTCVHLEFTTSNGSTGDKVCVKVKVTNFKSILSFQFPINYDPNVIMPCSKCCLANIVGFMDDDIVFDTIRKVIRVIYSNPNNDTVNLDDGTVLFEVCFKLIGPPGSCSNIGFSDRPIQTEFVKRFPVDNDIPVCVINDKPNNKICIDYPASLTVISSTCGTTANNGTITIKAWGGRAPYFVNSANTAPPTVNGVISNPGDCLIISNQMPGSYTFSVKDALGKDSVFTVTIPTSSSIDIRRDNFYSIDPTCWFSSNGRLGVNVTGGTAPLFIKWDPINVYGVNRVSGLPAGTYRVTVTDSSGCIQTQDLVLRADTLKAAINIDKAATCKGFCDGMATVRASGGTPYLGGKYEFVWSIKSSKDCALDTVCRNDSLCGLQYVVIRDSKRCEDTIYFKLPFTTEITSAITVDSVRCHGEASGVIHATAGSTSTLNLPLSFDLRDLTNTTIAGGMTNGIQYTSSQVIAGTYVLRITDNIGCERIDTIQVFEPPVLDLLENRIDTSESCSPGADAVLDVRGVGGSAPYNYSWSNSGNTGRITNLMKGTYTVTITDAHLCSVTKTYQISKPVAPVITGFNTTDVNCLGDTTGCVEVLFTPGNTPVSFKWNIPGNASKICSLGAGTYTVTITDQSGCADTATTMIKTVTNPIIIDSVVTINPSCPGKSDGLIILFAKGGTGQLTYSWNNNGNGPVNPSLKAGMYIVDIDDIGGCSALRDTFTLIDRPRPAIAITPVIDPSCAETASCDASAYVTINTNDTIVVVTWSSGEQNRYVSGGGVYSDTAKALCSGRQYAIITVNDLCSDTVFFDVKVPPRITLDSNRLNIIRPSCYGKKDGSITVAGKGGCMPYNYEWVNPVVTGPTLSSVGDGFYKVKITDCRGCVHFDSVRLRQPDTIRVQIIQGSTYDVSCPGQKDGRITLAWNGGSGGKGIFTWSPNVGKDSVLTSLRSGTYTVTVTDQNNCTGIASISLTEPAPLSLILTPIDTPACAEDQADFSVLNVLGGQGPAYRYTVDDGPPNQIGDKIPLFSGSYKITVYDKNGCTRDTIIDVPNPKSNLTLDFGKDIDTIQLGDSIRLIGVLNNSAAIMTYVWDPLAYVSNPQSTDSYVRPPQNTVFMLTVTDENGCIASDKITIIVESIRHFYSPNVISPNGDNTNDYLEFTAGSDVQQIEFVEVFDRWGGRLYSIQNPEINNGIVRTWDGRSHGDVVNPGVYVYQAKVVFRDGYTLVYRDDLTVVR
ncbi:MAG: gliding motility-associated C-terminal domain-containing protein [Saprospiraceae bacterium]|nr:gliding motility-associated C-terminal domain-containing protein [Saprospiraceae bacterium]HMW39527.1 gliding motility-associated C-terminal domain-containing protein [Saprospiraceae bacterium]HMX89465.1 gliding motility-associated C-terminal domain-containing protein [Saprospiraceae bacterium]HMZ41299.1 gliding motility-associated C-terminal domain-containing protein [Saprospiraceae bacterium]HNB30871.1 gliding motility-associated C-terminal domain-containing protein [Saprospiraceae bacteri